MKSIAPSTESAKYKSIMTRLLIPCFAVLLLVAPIAYGQEDSNDSSQCSVHEKSPEDWNRYYLTGPDGDAICVYLPLKPEKFAGGKLRGGNTPVTADVYLSGRQDEIYAVL